MFRRSSLLTAAGLLLVALPALVQAEKVKLKRNDTTKNEVLVARAPTHHHSHSPAPPPPPIKASASSSLGRLLLDELPVPQDWVHQDNRALQLSSFSFDFTDPPAAGVTEDVPAGGGSEETPSSPSTAEAPATTVDTPAATPPASEGVWRPLITIQLALAGNDNQKLAAVLAMLQVIETRLTVKGRHSPGKGHGGNAGGASANGGNAGGASGSGNSNNGNNGNGNSASEHGSMGTAATARATREGTVAQAKPLGIAAAKTMVTREARESTTAKAKAMGTAAKTMPTREGTMATREGIRPPTPPPQRPLLKKGRRPPRRPPQLPSPPRPRTGIRRSPTSAPPASSRPTSWRRTASCVRPMPP